MNLWAILYEYVLPAFLIAVMGGVFLLAKPITTAIAKWLERMGVEVEESRQRMFQTGIENAASAVIRRAGGGAITPYLIEQFGVRHMHEGVPDQIEHFKATDEAIARRVTDRIDDKLRRQTVVAPVIDVEPVVAATAVAPTFKPGRAAGTSKVMP